VNCRLFGHDPAQKSGEIFMPFLHRVTAMLAVLAALFTTTVNAQAPERRFALVIGNSEYKAGKQPTGANDAGLVAETLRTAGFDVSGARDLDQDTLRKSMREFLDKVAAAGPQAVAVVYLAGYGLQFEGENYFVPIDASIRRGEDIPIEAIRISDFTRPLAGTPGAVKMFIVDAARQHPFMPAGPPPASGLALVEPDQGMLIAFNATPGSIVPIENGPYGAYAQSLAEMVGTGGLGLDDLFARLRLRVNEKTNGLAVPWYAAKIGQPFLFMERAPNVPPPLQVADAMKLQSQPIREFRGDQEAYVAALERDTLDGYEEFMAAFPDSPLAARVRALIAVRREAITWRRTVSINTPEAYWSYLRRYPQGAHVPDAERRLSRIAAAYDPPPAFIPMAYDVPPPPPDEVVYLSQPAVYFDGPGFLPPPPIPVFFLPPPPPAFLVLAPPPPPIGAFFLPAPVIRVGLFARPPAFVVPPPPVVVGAVALPGVVRVGVASGALHAPPVGGPPPPRIQAAALTGTGQLGRPTAALPPHVGGSSFATPAGPQALTPPRPGANTATTTPVAPAAATPPRASGANTATTTTGPNKGTTATAPNATTATINPGSGAPNKTPPAKQNPATAAATPNAPTAPAPAVPQAPAAPKLKPVASPSAPTAPAPQVVSRPPPAAPPSSPAAHPATPPPHPQVAAKPPPPPAKKCVVEQGKQVCK
jgi:uncharacterized caspase-like protein